MFNDSYLIACMKLWIVQKNRFSLHESRWPKALSPGLVFGPSAKAQELLARIRGLVIQPPVEEDTSKIWDTTGTVFIQRPSILLLVWRSIMFNGSFLRVCRILWFVKKLDFAFLSLGGPSHGARVWCLGRVPKHRNHWQEVEGLLFSPQNTQLVHILSFHSQGVFSLFIFPTGPIALDSEPHGRRYVKNRGHNKNRLYSRPIHCPASMEKHYVQWFLLKSVQDLTVCEKNQILPS